MNMVLEDKILVFVILILDISASSGDSVTFIGICSIKQEAGVIQCCPLGLVKIELAGFNGPDAVLDWLILSQRLR